MLPWERSWACLEKSLALTKARLGVMRMATNKEKIRVLLSKSRLDAHDRGIRVLARALRDEGMEVVFTEYRFPEEIVKVALEEDVNIIGISFSSGGQVRVCTEVIRLLKEKGMDTPLIIGGGIPPFDVPKLEEIGVKGVFRGGSKLKESTDCIRNVVAQK